MLDFQGFYKQHMWHMKKHRNSPLYSGNRAQVSKFCVGWEKMDDKGHKYSRGVLNLGWMYGTVVHCMLKKKHRTMIIVILS